MHLLDTSVVLWALTRSSRLGRHTRRVLARSAAAHVSAVSIAELTVKSMLGKLSSPRDLGQLIVDGGLVELPLTARHAVALLDFPALMNHDPFDRLLVAQASVEHLTLLTVDRVLLGLGLDFVSDASE